MRAYEQALHRFREDLVVLDGALDEDAHKRRLESLAKVDAALSSYNHQVQTASQRFLNSDDRDPNVLDYPMIEGTDPAIGRDVTETQDAGEAESVVVSRGPPSPGSGEQRTPAETISRGTKRKATPSNVSEYGQGKERSLLTQ